LIYPTRPFPDDADSREAVARYYDELDVLCREFWGEHVHLGLWAEGNESPELAVRNLVERVVQSSQISQGCSVCDIGSGYGATARLLAREFGAKVTAITLSKVQHEYACSVEREPGDPVYLQGDWLENTLPDASFDLAIAIESSEYFEDKRPFFDEAARILRPNGRLVLCTWLAADQPRPWQKRHLLEPICYEGRIPAMGTQGDYRASMDAAGFAVREMEDLTHRVKRSWSTSIRRVLGSSLRKPAYFGRVVLAGHKSNRLFGRAIMRIWLAYRTGAMRYGLFSATKAI
jgi:tocopherol O-methyltransferase